MAVQIQIRRGTASAWTAANPTLAAGEFAIETDTDFYKIGDGSTAWTSLGYSSLPSGSALLASPTFTGVPAAPTAAADTNTTQIATTAYVQTELGALSSDSIKDADNDTKIQVEEASDEDIIRFDTAGTERMSIGATGTVTIVGDLTVNGTTTTINSTTLSVDDKNIELGSVATPSDTTADGGGITLKGASDKTILWTNSTDTWDFNQGITVTGTATATAFAGPLTGNASTATALATARTIGGTSFDGTANITPANATLAATATALATARTIGGTSFDGTANIAVGLAGTATALATARTIGGVSFDGTANIDLGTDANMVLASQSFS